MKNFKKHNKIIILSLIIMLILTILYNFSIEAVIVDTSGAVGSANNTNAMYDSEGNRYYCVQPGIELSQSSSTNYILEGTYEVTNQQLAYICSLEEDTADKCLGSGTWSQGGYYLGPKQNILWHWIYNNQGVQPFKDNNSTVKDIFGSIGTTGIYTSDSSSAYYGTGDSFATATGNTRDTNRSTYITFLNNMPLENVSTLNPIISINLSGENVQVTVNGLKASTTYTIYEDSYGTNLGNITTDTSGNANCSIATSKFQGQNSKVYIQYSESAYTATIKVYNTGSASQRIALLSGNQVVQDKIVKSNEIALNTNISLQKYIIKQNGNNITGRANKGAGGNSSISNIYSSTGTYINAEGNTKYNNMYKYEVPLEISVGDKITYRIIVYNNSNSIKASRVEIKDTLPSSISDIVTTSIGTFHSISTVSNGEITAVVTDLAAGGTAYFDVTVTFNEYKTGLIENKAYIASTTPSNNTTYRTEDNDFAKMNKLYQASIEKYISAVNGTSISGRNGLQTYGNTYPTADDNWNKKNNPYAVEKGDIVTYTIKLKNTGTDASAYGDISNIVVTDNGSSGNLQYVSCNGVSKSGNDFTYNGTISAGGTATFTITFEVISSSYGISIENFASIKSINGSAASSVDKDGLWNNGDRDWIKVKKYAASIKKYITQVNNNNLTANDTEQTIRNNILVATKKNNPVCLEVGDTVTYKIEVKNDGTNSSDYGNIKKIIVLDNGNSKLEYDSFSGSGITSIDGKTFTYNGDIAPNGSVSFIIKYRVISQGEIIDNTASITNIENKHGIVTDSSGNDSDSDYIKTKEYSVSLEKYVTNVESIDEAGNATNEDISGRDGKPEHKGYTWKASASNKEYVEVGDIVTYTIKLQNELDTYVKVHELKEIFNNSQLEYKSANDVGPLNSGIIALKNPIALNPNGQSGSSDTIKLKFLVKEKVSLKQIKNTASITGVKLTNRNGNNYIVTDKNNSDNVDSDYIYTKEYKISLEKYVVKVENAQSAYDKKVTYNSEARKGKARNYDWKENNEVYVESGDTVTYKFILTNKGDTTVGINKIEEQFNDLDPNSIQVLSGNNKEHGCSFDGTYITFTKPILMVAGADPIEVVIKGIVNPNLANTANSRSIKNQATVTGLVNKHYMPVEESSTDEKKDNVDADWVHTKTYAVSLEKYVTQIEDTNISNRLGNPIYKNNNKRNYKPEGEVGDTVIYTIRLKNTDTTQNTAVAITEVTEVEFDYLQIETQDVFNDKNEVVGKYDANTKKIILNTIYLDPNEYIDIIIKGKIVLTRAETATSKIVKNTAQISSIINRNSKPVNDKNSSDNKDSDFISTKLYSAQLEKYITAVNGQPIDETSYVRTGKPEYNVAPSKPESKRNNACTVSKGDFVTYTIKLTNNNEETAVRFAEIKDILPMGIGSYKIGGYSQDTNAYTTISSESQTARTIIIRDKADELVNIGEFTTLEVTVEVIEPNISLRILENKAEIISLTNIHNNPIADDTTDNYDRDYIQLNFGPNNPMISGKVWKDIAVSGKDNDFYNGQYDNNEELLGEEVRVYLYRRGIEGAIAEKDTEDGKYAFIDSDIKNSVPESQRYIKGPKNGNSWVGTYYAYYIVFEYDGITYTSTIDRQGNTYKNITNNESKSVDASYTKDSNARELEDHRENFNNKFTTINPNGAYDKHGEKTTEITYDKLNISGYIPQSHHKYNDAMKIQSKTDWFDLETIIKGASNNNELEARLDQLTNIDLGLRGRDIFDLEIISDVHETKIKINNQVGVYKNSNIVNLRIEDTNDIIEDMANKNQDKMIENYVKDGTQSLRAPDLYNDNERKTEYNKKLQEIIVTYKITVQNLSNTNGKATRIVNHFDKKYYTQEGLRAYYYLDNNSEKTLDSELKNESGANYNSVIIDISDVPEREKKVEVYLSLKLNKDKLEDYYRKNTQRAEKFCTYNMSEIYEYTTSCGENQTEFTRGLLDKDSEPGSANTENVNLVPNIKGEDTTAKYYFKASELNKLKYEDDTHTSPTLYFTLTTEKRTIKGNVFEDYTEVNENKVRTGDGERNKNAGHYIEPGIHGIRVELIEKTEAGPILRYTTKTAENGNYTFEGFLPGDYIIRYYYGDNENTFYEKNSINSKSYNGEDFQATNNTGNYGAKKLNDSGVYWYINNSAGISTGIDNEPRRATVSKNVSEYDNYQIQVLNNIRDGKNKENSKVTYKKAGVDTIVNPDNIMQDTYMYADTPEMTFEVELINNVGEKQTAYSTYTIENMNFGIAEVPVTTVDLQKHVNNFKIIDSAGENTLASAKVSSTKASIVVNKNKADDEEKNRISVILNGLTSLEGPTTNAQGCEVYYIDKTEDIRKIKEQTYKYSLAHCVSVIPKFEVTAGNVLVGEKDTGTVLDISIEEVKLQGAKLQVTYDITANIYPEKNFKNTIGNNLVPTIKGIRDYIDNNLSYIQDTAVNKGWKISSTTGDRFGNQYTSSVDADNTTGNENELLKATSVTGGTAQITLERVLTSTDSTIEDIITSSIETFEYTNNISITELNYDNMKETLDIDGDGIDEEITFKDRIRTPDRYIILPGVDHDTVSAETISIHPPTGDSGPSLNYYIITAISLAILAVGAFGIKKFVVKK